MNDQQLETLFREHADALAVYLSRRYPAGVAFADDAVSHAFLKLRDQAISPRNVAAWLSTVASRRMLDLIRSEARYVSALTSAAEPGMVTGPPTLSRTTTRSLNAQLVHHVLQQLSSRDRELLTHMYQEDGDQRSVAATFGLSVGSVGRTMARARARFRDRFESAMERYRAAKR